MSHPEGTDTARIIELARSFPSIADHPAVIEWNPDALAKWYAVASSGERLAVQFVLGVWNQYEEWSCGRFDVIEAFGRWDDKHWAAFQAWTQEPFTL